LLEATPAVEMNLRMPGQYLDAETGHFYNYHRNMNPSIGRYTQRDPIGLDGGLNGFGYVEGNPLSGIDPTGLCPWCLPVAGVVAAGYGIKKFIDASCTALDSGANYQRKQNEMQDWIKNDMKGAPPHSQQQLQDAKAALAIDAGKAASEGAAIIPQPLTRTGSLLKFFTK